jgi:hypothetical protein
VQLKQRIVLDRKLQDLSAKVTKNPADQQAKQQLTAAADEAASQSIASPVMLANLAASKAAIGRTAEAAAINQKALAINPNLPAARQLQQKIGNGR